MRECCSPTLFGVNIAMDGHAPQQLNMNDPAMANLFRNITQALGGQAQATGGDGHHVVQFNGAGGAGLFGGISNLMSQVRRPCRP